MEHALVTIGAHEVPDVADCVDLLDWINVHALPAQPARTQYDAVLDALAGRRMVIAAQPAALAGLLRRIMRRGELATTETAVLLADTSAFLQGLGISAHSEDNVHLIDQPCRTVGVLKDDSGNLVIDSAELRPWSGSKVWVRAYVEDECLCDGEVAWLRVEHRPGGGLRASVPRSLGGSRFGRVRALEGRGLSLACEDAAISSDGAPRDQPRRKRIWWDEPDQWLLACPPR